MARSAAFVLISGLAAGCSSDVSRFQDGIFTGASKPTNRAVAASDQPYPGDDRQQTAALDNTQTGSVERRAPRPQAAVGGAGANANGASAQANAASAGTVERRPLDPSGEPAAQSERQASPSVASTRSLDDATTGTAGTNSTETSRAERGQPGWSNSGGNEITVREGETVYNLSRRFGVPVDAILAANDMSDGSGLEAGQTLAIPRYVDGRDVPVSAPDNDPKVAEAGALPKPSAPGDDSSGRGERVAVLPQTQKPEEGSEDESSGEPAASRAGEGGAYTVASGDTLYGISRKTGVSADRIKAANGLDDGYLQIGQKLEIPGAGDGRQDSEGTKVADAESVPEKDKEASGDVDPVVTSGADKDEEPDTDVREVSTYTPPTGSDDGEDGDEDTQVAAVAPDSTGIQRLRWPVRGRVVGNFGESSGSSNDGIDIAVPEGTPVKSAENGVVIYAGDGLKDFGNTVLVRHEDGLVTVYGHAGSLKVKRGEEVGRGQELALSGMSGSADRPKLHFEVRRDSRPVDPVQFLQ